RARRPRPLQDRPAVLAHDDPDRADPPLPAQGLRGRGRRGLARRQLTARGRKAPCPAPPRFVRWVPTIGLGELWCWAPPLERFVLKHPPCQARANACVKAQVTQKRRRRLGISEAGPGPRAAVVRPEVVRSARPSERS